MIRDCLDNCDTYECAIRYISETNTGTPAHFIVAGIKGNEGAVISKNRFSVANITPLTDDRWFLI